MSGLLERAHTLPLLRSMNPNQSRLIRRVELSPALNPFHAQGTRLHVLLGHGEMLNIKIAVAWNLILTAIEEGRLTEESVVVESSSGNTGIGLAIVCNALQIPLRLILPVDTAEARISAIRAYGRLTRIEIHSGPLSPVAQAREEGKQPGFVHVDQYGNKANWQTHFKWLAPQIFGRRGVTFEPALVAVALGTCGTAIGIAKYIAANGLETEVVGVVPKDEVPGTRCMERIERDVTLPWQENIKTIVIGTREEAFRLSRELWREVQPPPGPSSGLAYGGLLSHIGRDPARYAGKEVAFISADNATLYSGLYFGTMKEEQFRT